MMSKRTRDTSFQPPQAPPRMRGSERGRPSMGIQNLDTMGTVYWTASEEEATEFGAGAGREDATRRTRTTTTLRLRPSHFAATNFGHEAMLFLELAFTTAMMYLGFAMSPLITASFVGRLYGPVYLSGFSFANLMGNLCTQTLVTGLFGAIDTLSPQAFARGEYAEVGYLMIRGTLASIVFLIPINIILVVYMQDLLIALGEDAEAAHVAQAWYRVFVWSLPCSIVYQAVCKFLTVQRIMVPVIVVSLVSTACIIPTLHVCCAYYGYLGTALAYDVNWLGQALLLGGYVVYAQPHDPRTWPVGGEGGGYTRLLTQAVGDGTKVRAFVWLGFGGMLSQCEWVFWEALGLVVGKLGIVAMSVHTIPNQIVMNVSTIPISFGIALAVRLGLSFPSSVRRTQHIAVIVTAMSMLVFAILSILLYLYRDFFIEIFVNKDDDDGDDNTTAVFDLAEAIWPLVSIYNMNVALFGLLAGIASGLAKQWDLAMINVFWLWCFGMPIIYYTTIIQDGGSLKDAWYWMNIAYVGINASLLVVFLRSDWYKIQDAILQCGDDEKDEDQAEESDTIADDQARQTTTETTRLL